MAQDAAARLDRARRALAAAETSTGLRARLGAAAPTGSLAPASDGGVDRLRAGDPEAYLPAPTALAGLFPGGGVRRGTAVQVTGSSAVLLGLAASLAGDERWAALVALPDLGLAAAADAGVDPARTLVVPRPGADAPTVLGALVDGVDVLVLGRCEALTDADRRSLTTRLRTREAVLLSAAPWPGAQAVLRVGASRWVGAGRGDGLLREREVEVSATARGSGAPAAVRVRLGADGMAAAEPAGPGRRVERAPDLLDVGPLGTPRAQARDRRMRAVLEEFAGAIDAAERAGRRVLEEAV